MPSKHADPSLGVRAPAELRAKALAALGDRGKELQAFITACLTAVTENPEQVLADLDKYWPPRKEKGRAAPEPEPAPTTPAGRAARPAPKPSQKGKQ